MNLTDLSTGVMLFRIVFAGICAIIVGYGRQRSNKPSGIKTHMVVAFASALFILISKYGFADSQNFDPTRIASQIVSGISFLGTGIIIKRHANIEGLTDAATIWCSAAIGMAAGAGLYWLAILASILLVIGTNVLHLLEKNHRDRQDSYMITCDSIDALNQLIQENQSSMSWHRVEKHGKKEYLIRLQMDFENKDVREKWETEIFSNPSVSSFRFLYPTD